MTPLHQLGSMVRELILMIPMSAVRLMFVALPVVILVWLLRLPKEATAETPTAPWSRDLKVWAALALVIQIAIYSLV